jgi:hypothetical protein
MTVGTTLKVCQQVSLPGRFEVDICPELWQRNIWALCKAYDRNGQLLINNITSQDDIRKAVERQAEYLSNESITKTVTMNEKGLNHIQLSP